MANPFQRYQSGGFEAVPGIAQAGANIGQMLGSGFSNFGGSIGAGIKQYYENKAKSTAAMQEIEVLGPQLLARRNAYLEASGIDPAMLDRYMQDDPSEGTDDEMFKTISANPMVQLAKTLDPAIEALKKAPTKGLSAQLAALNSGKAAIGMVDEQIKLQDFVAKYRLEQTLNDLPDSVSVEQDVVTPDALFDPNDPLFTNVDKVRADLTAAGFSKDKVERGVRQYLDQSGAKIRANETLGTPEQRAALIDALNRYAEGKLDIKGELTPVGESYEYQEESARQDKLHQETIMSIAKEKAKAADAEELLAQRAAGKLKREEETKAAVAKFGSNLMADVKITLDDAVIKGQEITPRQLLGVIAGKEYSQNPSGPAVNVTQVRPRIGMGGAGMPGGGGFSGFEKREANPQYKPSPAFEQLKKTIGELGVDMNKPLDEVAMFKIRKALGIYEEKNKETSAATTKKAENITTQSVRADMEQKAQPPAAKSKPFSVGELDLGTEIVDRRLNAAEKEAAAREFYAKRFGSVPPGFTQMYRQMFPEATVRTTEVNGIPVMVDGKGNVTPLVSNKEQDVEKQAAAKALTFDNTEIADGVRLSGVFAGTVAGAMAFRKDYAHMANVRSAVDELIKINEMGYETLSPTARARADQLQSEIIAAMRIPIVGPGQVAIPEQQILERIIQKGTGFFTLESGERAALKGLKDRMERELTNWPKSMGLEVKIGGQSSETIKRLRMQKLRSARNLKPIGEAR